MFCVAAPFYGAMSWNRQISGEVGLPQLSFLLDDRQRQSAREDVRRSAGSICRLPT